MSLHPTDEQRSVLDAEGRVVLVNARAGTGKTATLRMIAAANPRARILYLAFNKRASVEAQDTFPAHVQATTIHSLAYRNEISSGKWPAFGARAKRCVLTTIT